MVYQDDCECSLWVRPRQKFFTNHHPMCESYNAEGDAHLIVTKLLEELELWINGHEIKAPEHIREVLYMGSLLVRHDLDEKLRPKHYQKSKEGV